MNSGNRNRLFILIATLLATGLACNALSPAQPVEPTTINTSPPEEPMQAPTLAEETEPPADQGLPTRTPSTIGFAVLNPPTSNVRIAILGPESGVAAEAMEAVEAGVQLAVDDYGTIKGYSIEVETFNSGCNADTGRSAAQEIDAWPRVMGVIGPVCSLTAQGALPVISQSNLVVISPSATRPGVNSYAPHIFNRVILHEGQPGSQGGAEVDDLTSVQDFYQRLSASLPEDSRYFAAYAYDSTMILLQAVDQVSEGGGDQDLVTNVQQLIDAVRGTEGYQGVTGSISFDESGNRVP